MDRKLRMSELNRVSTEDFKKQQKFPITLVLDNIRSSLNVGSAFRSADAFNTAKVILIGQTPTPDTNPDMRKTALGGTDSVDWEFHPSITDSIHQLKKNGFTIYGIEQTEKAIQLQQWQPTINEKTAFVFGNEVNGVSDEAIALCDTILEIPQFGTKHSLNIAVSLGIVLWHRVQYLINS
jgi:23S rRNA (guanosine2251-2'-O)-methyltransferase